VLPIDCPTCDFLVTVSADDWLFLIGRQRAPQDAATLLFLSPLTPNADPPAAGRTA